MFYKPHTLSLGNVYPKLRYLFIKISQASILLPVFTGLVHYKRLTTPYRILLYLLIFSGFIEITSGVFKTVVHNNMPVMHLLVPVELLAYSFIYIHHFKGSETLQRAIVMNIIVFGVVWVLDTFIVNSIWSLISFSRTYAAVSQLCYSLIYFHFMFSRDTPEYSTEHPMFWVNIGVIVYYGSNILYFIPTNLLLRHHPTANFGLYTHDVVNIIAHCLYAKAFTCFRKQKAA